MNGLTSGYARLRVGRQAFNRFPDLIDRFDLVNSPYELWIELSDAFQNAYKSTPRNEDLISRISDCATWSCSQPRGAMAKDDQGTCVCVCFYEHIPKSPEALEDMPRWFSRSEVLLMKEIFSYMVGEEDFNESSVRTTDQAECRYRSGRRILGAMTGAFLDFVTF